MSDQSEGRKVREAMVAGLFYPDDPAELAASITDLLSKQNPTRSGALAILAPHACLEYSGPIAAAAWNAASGRQIKTIVMLAPNHRAATPEVFLPEADIFQTPLGTVEVDRALVEELESCATIFRVGDIPHFEEQGIEAQLPFAQVLFPRARIVPMLMGLPAPAAITAMAHALDSTFSDTYETTLFVASTNLSSDADEHRAAERSNKFVESTTRKEWHVLAREDSHKDMNSYGTGCVATLLACRLIGQTNFECLARGNSAAKRTNPDERVVHYAAAAWFRLG